MEPKENSTLSAGQCPSAIIKKHLVINKEFFEKHKMREYHTMHFVTENQGMINLDQFFGTFAIFFNVEFQAPLKMCVSFFICTNFN